MSTPHDDYDSPWKDALGEYFEEFVALLFPVTHADIDWNKPIEFLDKELHRTYARRTIEIDPRGQGRLSTYVDNVKIVVLRKSYYNKSRSMLRSDDAMRIS